VTYTVDEILGRRKKAVSILLGTIPGEQTDREGLLDTPARVCKMYDEIFAGYQMDPWDILSRTFQKEDHQEMVIVKDIEFYSHCEHHMVPFFGVAHVGYIPNGTIVGISKLARLVECFAKRLQVQERMTSQIADSIQSALSPMGVAVVIEAQHLCMSMRGVKKPEAKTITSAMRGVFLDNANSARSEFLGLIK
jgi:GTP cyclohydrolase I